MIWYATHDGDPAAYQLMTRHYTFQKYADGRRSDMRNPNRFLICGPGEKMVLVTPDYSALFIWRKFIDDSGQVGINCAVFHNESEILSSLMILEAEELAWARWPGERLYTYVNAKKVKSANPGYCFLMAGWQKCGLSQAKKLIILEKKK